MDSVLFTDSSCPAATGRRAKQLPRLLLHMRSRLDKIRAARRTLHVEALQDEELVVAGLVEEGGQPGLVPDAAVRVPELQLLVARDHRHPRQRPQPTLHV
jgi:hypothetical protein